MATVTNHLNEFMEAVTTGVRIFSRKQLEDHWCGGSSKVAGELIADLKGRGLVTSRELLIHPPPPAVRPEFCWRPGDWPPDFLPVAFRLRRRWPPIQTITLYFPTAKAAKQFGGMAVRPRASELSHDLHLAEVFLRYRQRGLMEVNGLQWISGDLLRAGEARYRWGGAIPDAVLVNRESGELQKIIEGGGRYQRSKLEALHHAYCDFPYEIW